MWGNLKISVILSPCEADCLSESFPHSRLIWGCAASLSLNCALNWTMKKAAESPQGGLFHFVWNAPTRVSSLTLAASCHYCLCEITAKYYSQLRRALLTLPQSQRKALPTKTPNIFICGKAGGRQFMQSCFCLSHWVNDKNVACDWIQKSEYLQHCCTLFCCVLNGSLSRSSV